MSDAGDAPTVVQPAAAPAVRLAEHPRARRGIGRARALAGLLVLLLALVLSLRAGLSPFEATLRALAFGVAAHFVAWIVAVVAWRHLALAELELARRRVEERRAARLAAERARAAAA